MKKADLYAQAFMQSVADESVDVAQARLTALKNLVEKKEGASLLKKVLHTITTALTKKEHAITACITVARSGGEVTHAKAIHMALSTLSAEDAPQKIVIDPTLIDGFTIVYKGVLHDRSSKRTLLKLYSSLTA